MRRCKSFGLYMMHPLLYCYCADIVDLGMVLVDVPHVYMEYARFNLLVISSKVQHFEILQLQIVLGCCLLIICKSKVGIT